MERATETVKVKFIDESEGEVKIAKFINARQKQKLLNKLLEGKKIGKSSNADDLQFDADKSNELLLDLATMIWADDKHKLDDVQADSLSDIIQERFNRFLGGSGFSA